MSNLWPPVGISSPRTMAEMLYDAAGDLARVTNNKLDFYVDAVGVADPPAGPVTRIRYNCYIRVIKTGNVHLFFQVTTPSAGAFDAELGTPEGIVSPRSKMKRCCSVRSARSCNDHGRRRSSTICFAWRSFTLGPKSRPGINPRA